MNDQMIELVKEYIYAVLLIKVSLISRLKGMRNQPTDGHDLLLICEDASKNNI